MGPRSPIDPIDSIPEDPYTAIVVTVDPRLDILKCTMVMPPITEKGACATVVGLSAAPPFNFIRAASGDVVGEDVVGEAVVGGTVVVGVAVVAAFSLLEVPLQPMVPRATKATTTHDAVRARGDQKGKRHRYRGLTGPPPWETSLTDHLGSLVNQSNPTRHN
jgi:hypothetical protein